MEDNFDITKNAVLGHMQSLFEELEEEMVHSHQEKYTLLEDAFESAAHEDELKVAFDQWYRDHAEELELEYNADELWELALTESEE